MASEQSPIWANMFGSALGSQVFGNSGGNRRLDRSIDRLEQVLSRFADTMSRLSAAQGKSGTAGVTTQAGGRVNGGGSTFNGQPTPAGGRSSGQPLGVVQGAAAALTQQSGQHSNGGGVSWGTAASQSANRYIEDNAGRIAGGAVAATASAGAIYLSNHGAGMVVGEQIAKQYGGANWSQAYRTNLTSGFSAANQSDYYGSRQYLAQTSGYGLNDPRFDRNATLSSSASAVNPAITNTQAAQNQVALGSTGSFNRLQSMGITPLNSQGDVDPRNLARQIIDRMGGMSKIKDQKQIDAAFGPAGSATVTLQSYVSQGLIPQSAVPQVAAEIRQIATAQLGGMSYSDYNKNALSAEKYGFSGAGGTARAALAAVNVGGADTQIQRTRAAEGMSREGDASTFEAFIDGLQKNTEASYAVRDAFNKFLGISPFGQAVGEITGLFGGGGAFGWLAKAGKAITPGAGGMAPTMSSSRFGSGRMAPASQAGPGYGGAAPVMMSRGSGEEAHREAGGGSAGVHLVAPRPGLNSMSSEQDYGARSIGQGWHTGVDLSGEVGNPIKAAASGTVVTSKKDPGYGFMTVLDHGGGWKTMYAHMAHGGKSVGTRLRQGETVGPVGATGSYAQGSHLHFEVWKNGSPVDPEPYLRGKALVGATGGSGNNTNTGPPIPKAFVDSLKGCKPWVIKAAWDIKQRFPGISSIGGYAKSGHTSDSDHYSGLALDLMVYSNKSLGDRIASFVIANKAKLGMTYLIWHGRIYHTYGEWGKYTPPSGATDPTSLHMDHVHVSFGGSPPKGYKGGLIGGTKGNQGGGGASDVDNGSTDSFANSTSGGGGSAGGYFSETAALSLSSSSGGAGGVFGNQDTTGADGTNQGGTGSSGGPSGPGDVRIGAYNVWKETSKKETQADINRITGMVDVAGFSEARKKAGDVRGALKSQGWAFYQGNNATDTGIGYNKDKYNVLQKGSKKIEGTLWNGKKMSNAVPYMLLQDKDTKAKFWVMEAHTQVHGYKGGQQAVVMRKQYAQIRALYDQLKDSGSPVFLLGDLNNPHAQKDGIAPKGANYNMFGHLDYVISSGANMTGHGGLKGQGFDNHTVGGPMNSDHPFVWGTYNIGGNRNGSGPQGGLPNGGSPSENIALGKVMAARAKWTGDQWDALRKLWMKESSWNTTADNPTSSAYGIPQSLPGSKMAAAGKDWRTNPKTQIEWGLDYIRDRYGDPKHAWKHSQQTGWYAMGEWNIANDQNARVHKGEMIVPTKIADILRDELTAPGIRDNLGRRNGGGSGVTIAFGHGSVTFVVGDGSRLDQRTMQQAADVFAERLAADNRIKRLSEGL